MVHSVSWLVTYFLAPWPERHISELSFCVDRSRMEINTNVELSVPPHLRYTASGGLVTTVRFDHRGSFFCIF